MKKLKTKSIERWLRMVDKPLATKEEDKKDAKPRKKVAIVKMVRRDLR